MDTPLDDIEFLTSSRHRVRVLTALREGEQDREDLRMVTGASSPTMSRILADFEDRHWIERTGENYDLTVLGAFVADQISKFANAMSHERQLREVWPWMPHDLDGFSVELFTDVVISRPGPGYPYTPIERVAELITATSTMRGFGMPMLKSGNLKPFFDGIMEGLECEYLYPPAVFEELLAWDEEIVSRASQRENYTVLLHDALPLEDRCGICVLDERVTICCYDPTTQTLQSMVDTGSDEMRDWAERYIDQFREVATPLDEIDHGPPFSTD